jgi:hypothetical protein
MENKMNTSDIVIEGKELIEANYSLLRGTIGYKQAIDLLEQKDWLSVTELLFLTHCKEKASEIDNLLREQLEAEFF